MDKKIIPKWLQIHDDGTLTVTWKDGTKLDPFDDIETALRQMVHIMEQYGNQKIYLDTEKRVVIFIGRIGELKQFQELSMKILGFLQSSSLDSNIGVEIRKQINKSEKDILTSISSEIEKGVRIYFAVMRRGLVIKEEIIKEKRILVNIYTGLVNSYDSLNRRPTKFNLARIKNKIATGRNNLVNGFQNILVNPYKKRTLSSEVKRLRTISDVEIPQLQRIIKHAANKVRPIIEQELENEGIRREIYIN